MANLPPWLGKADSEDLKGDDVLDGVAVTLIGKTVCLLERHGAPHACNVSV